MPELLNKVNQSREVGKNIAGSIFSDGGTVYQKNVGMFSDGFAAQPQQNQSSSFQGAGLRLSLLSQQLSANSKPGSYLSPGTVHNHASENCDLEVEGYPKRTDSNSLVPERSLSTSQDFRLYDQQGRSILSSQITKETSESSPLMVNDYMATKSSDMMYVKNKSHHHQFSDLNGNTAINYSNNLLPTTQYDQGSYTTSSSQQQMADSLDRASVISPQSVPGSSLRVPPFELASSALDTHSHIISQPHHNTLGQSQPVTDDNSYKRNSQNHLHKPDSVHVSHPSLMSGVFHNAWINTDKIDDKSNPHIVGTHSSHPQNLNSHALHNLWTNIPTQRLPINMSKESLNSFQTINLCKQNTSSWNTPNICNQEQKGGQSKSHIMDAYPSNPQNISHAKENLRSTSLKHQYSVQGKVNTSLQTYGASHEKESPLTQTSDGKSGKAGPYSLLQQAQTMKSIETNPMDLNKSIKRLKQTEIRLDSQQLFGKPSQKIFGYDTNVNSSADELCAVVHNGSFTSDSRMLSFSSEETEQENLNKSQGVDHEINHDMGSSRINVSQGYPYSRISSNQLNSQIRPQHIYGNPQMVSTWFKHYGNLSNENIPAVFSDPHKNIKLSTEPDFPHTASEGMARIVVEGGRDADKIGCTLQIASSTSPGANDQLSSLEISSPGIPDFEVKMPKKRKNATSELQPWHIEINQQYDIRKLIRYKAPLQ